MCGGTPADAVATTRPRGVRPCSLDRRARSRRRSRPPRPTAATRVPAVTMPSAPERRLELRERLHRRVRPRHLVLGRRAPSLTGTSTRSAWRCSAAAAVRCCERRPHASDSSREMPSSTATSSAVSPRLIVALPPSTSRMRGLTRRQPSVVSAISGGAPQLARGLRHRRPARASSTRRRPRRRRPPRRCGSAARPTRPPAGSTRTAGSRCSRGSRRSGPRAGRPCARRCGCPRPPGWRRRR